MTEGNLPEDFPRFLNQVFRPMPTAPSDTVRVAHIFCAKGEHSQIANEAGLNVVYAEEPDEEARDAYADNLGLTPQKISRAIDFKQVPPFDVLLVSLPKSEREKAISYALRFLHIRRPRVFLMVGDEEGQEEALGQVEKGTDPMGYAVDLADSVSDGQFFVVGALGELTDMNEQSELGDMMELVRDWARKEQRG